jgi:hypothetical protein
MRKTSIQPILAKIQPKFNQILKQNFNQKPKQALN